MIQIGSVWMGLGNVPMTVAATTDAAVSSIDAVVADLPLHLLVLVVAVLLSVATLAQLSRPTDEWRAALTDHLLLGVPWGTLLVMSVLIAVYFGLQGGLTDPNEPIVLPFRAWSYFDPLGIALASFSHASYDHLVGNLLGTLVFGSFAEFVWRHRVDRRFETPRLAAWTNPIVRAVVIFPAAVVAVGLVGSILALGPIIGFSTVVYAFVGFTLVRYPLATVIASVGQGVIGSLFTAVRAPQQVAVAEATYNTPWFASIAVQGHALGLILGVLCGLALQYRRHESPPPATRLWLGALLIGVSRSLWIVYWYRGNEVYVLYRAVGMALVFVLVALITYAVVARDTPLFPARTVGSPNTVRSGITSITNREFALLLLLCGGAVIVGPAIPVNLVTADDAALPGEPIEIRDYEITYGEDVPDGQLSVLQVEGFGETTQLNTSGVIVRNTDRHIWATVVTSGELATEGEATIRLGGLGWQESVTAQRTGWRTVGGEAAYRVSLTHDGQTQPLYRSESARADAIIAGYNITVAPTASDFEIRINDGTTTERAAIPATNETVAVGPIEFVRRGDRLVAVHEETVVGIARRE